MIKLTQERIEKLQKEWEALKEQKLKLEITINSYTDRLHQLKGAIINLSEILEEFNNQKGEQKENEIQNNKSKTSIGKK